MSRTEETRRKDAPLQIGGLLKYSRLEFTMGRSNKFYEAYLSRNATTGASVVTFRWGRIGTGGQTSDPEYFSDSYQAAYRFRVKLRSKIEEGYQLVVGDDEPYRGSMPPAVNVAAARRAAADARGRPIEPKVITQPKSPPPTTPAPIAGVRRVKLR